VKGETMNEGIEILFEKSIVLKTSDDELIFEIEVNDTHIGISILTLDEVDYEDDGVRHYDSLFEEYINKENGERG
jgi:hypothetical protein|tara:strand:- start:3721 stop:3945 length:225 start_codon:yes stop_codon:yes gene_type:complete